jgi:hypothetical protein
MRANQRWVAVLRELARGRVLLVITALMVVCSAALPALGQNWTLTLAPSNSWTAIAASADLSKIIAAASPGGIYYSLDSGTNWTESDAPTNNWSALAFSSSSGLLPLGQWTKTDWAFQLRTFGAKSKRRNHFSLCTLTRRRFIESG